MGTVTSGSSDIIIIAAVSVLVFLELLRLLWPIIRPPERQSDVCAALQVKAASLETKVDTLVNEFRQETTRFQAQCSETLRLASTACDQNGKQFELLRENLRKIDDLHEWHNVTDPTTGAKIWYVQKALLDGVKATADATNAQIHLIEEIRTVTKQFLAAQKELMDRMNL